MRSELYKRKKELYDGWTKLFNSNRYEMSFDECIKIMELENDLYNRWCFYDKLLYRLEVVNHGNKKKKSSKNASSPYQTSKARTRF